MALQCPFVQNRAVAARHVSRNPDGSDLTIGVAQQPAAGLVVALVSKGQAIVLGKIIETAGRAVQRQVGGRGHHDPAVVGQTQANDAGVVQVANTNSAVIALFDQVDQPVGQVEGNGYLGDVLQKFRQERGHMLAAKAGRGADAKMAAGLFAALGNPVLGIGEFSQNTLCLVKQQHAFGG